MFHISLLQDHLQIYSSVHLCGSKGLARSAFSTSAQFQAVHPGNISADLHGFSSADCCLASMNCAMSGSAQPEHPPSAQAAKPIWTGLWLVMRFCFPAVQPCSSTPAIVLTLFPLGVSGSLLTALGEPNIFLCTFPQPR